MRFGLEKLLPVFQTLEDASVVHSHGYFVDVKPTDDLQRSYFRVYGDYQVPPVSPGRHRLLLFCSHSCGWKDVWSEWISINMCKFLQAPRNPYEVFLWCILTTQVFCRLHAFGLLSRTICGCTNMWSVDLWTVQFADLSFHRLQICIELYLEWLSNPDFLSHFDWISTWLSIVQSANH